MKHQTNLSIFFLNVANLLVAAAALSLACKTKPAKISSSPPEPVYFSKNWKAEIGFPTHVTPHGRTTLVRSENGNLAAFLPTSDGLLQSSSSDNGRTWISPRLIFPHKGPAYPILVGGEILGVFTLEYVANGGQIYCHARNGESWNHRRPIRDTNWGDFRWPAFATDSTGSFYCAWTDWREGNPDVYFSSSFDGGNSWTSNVRIDDDQSGQEQQLSVLLSNSMSILFAFWADNRRPETLFDLYCSSSYDRGRTWSSSVRINDDTTRTFQIQAWSVFDAQNSLYAAWTDYRDKGASGDVLANVYFATSKDGGRSWSPNVRISEARSGHHWRPWLAYSAGGQLNCIWRNLEDNLLGDVCFSYSQDNGRTWSEPARVNDDLERVQHMDPIWLGAGSNGNEMMGWLDWRNGKPEIYLAQLLKHSEPNRPERKPPHEVSATEVRPFLSVDAGKILFQDHFSPGPSPQWKVESGVWVCKEQTYVGYGASESRTFAGSEAWGDYIFSGRFKLDPLDHRAALLYLRVSRDRESRLCFYRLNNFFRSGVTLEYFDGRAYVPIMNVSYAFQSNQWYDFRTVVKDSVINHFINDSLLIASDKLTHNLHGRVGIGAISAPTYFKNILVTAIK